MTVAIPSLGFQSTRELRVHPAAVVRGYQAAAKAPATRRAYAADWRRFASWCEDRDKQSLPATAETVAQYLADAAECGYKATTITRWAGSISQAHQAAGYGSPTSTLAVRATLQGIRRTLSTNTRQATAITTPTLRRMLHHVSRRNGKLRVLRDRALLLVGFASALRRSELVGLNVEDIDESADGLVLHVRHSKTDQEGAGRSVGVCHGQWSDSDPVAAVRAWLAAAKISSGPVFRPIDMITGALGDGRLSDDQVSRVVQGCARRARLPHPERYSGHSLRAGLATSAAAAGAAEADIARQTGHRSLTVLRGYIRDGSLFRANVSALVGL